ncbi:MAG: TonB-dependent receptor [Flavobacteriales bacterium]|nr:TonB-dependent receptor [Flavobacteriales bacterium]MDW8409356.1 TonB-dependent receptor [Flavobacteriales bacterium]
MPSGIGAEVHGRISVFLSFRPVCSGNCFPFIHGFSFCPHGFQTCKRTEGLEAMRKGAMIGLGLGLSWYGSQETYPQRAASDSARTLKPVAVEAPRMTYSSLGQKIIDLDSLTLKIYSHRPVGELLADENGMFVKTYGPGLLATPAQRGGSAYHTAVVWHGIPLTSPMNGQVDLSLLPVQAAGRLRLSYGGGSALFGSGAVAGLVHLGSAPRPNTGLEAGMQFFGGSFGDFRQSLSASYAAPRWSTSLRFFHATARNDFPFRNSGGAIVRQTHALQLNQGVVGEHSLNLGKYHYIHLFFWGQQTRRHIPPTLLESQGRFYQTDEAARGGLEWQRERNRSKVFARTALLNDRLLFTDGLLKNADTSRALQWVSELEFTYRPAQGHLIYGGLHHIRASGSHPAYGGSVTQYRTAAMCTYRLASRRETWLVALSLRQEVVGLRPLPFTFTLGGEYKPWKWMALRANGHRVYRIPTFNDLYWNPGGNPHLKPESGFAAEGGLGLSWDIGKLQLSTDAALFSRWIHNWIVWLPDISYWTPRNILYVWSRGTETLSRVSLRLGSLKIALTLSTSYVLSTPQRPSTANDNSVHRQLIYTPMYTGMARLVAEWKGLVLMYRHIYVSNRYISTDNTQYLPPYDIGSFVMSYTMVKSSVQPQFFIQINNIWNEQYQIISQRPMPGLNFGAGVALSIRKNFSKSKLP